MIVGICGYGNTGASAVLDYLREFENVNLFDRFEFQLLHQPDGINDLKYHLTVNRERITVNVAIQRFIKSQRYGLFANQIRALMGKNVYDRLWKSYIDDLVIASWNGEPSSYDPLDISSIPKLFFVYRCCRKIDEILKKFNKNAHFYKYQEKKFSILSEEKFDLITQKFLNQIFHELEIDTKEIAVVDMLFSATNLEQGTEFFDDCKSILVNRDPRDIYVSAHLHPEDSRFMPNDNVRSFVSYYKAIQENIQTNNPNILVIQYEDLIYDYDKTIQVINSFLGLTTFPHNEFMFFDPTISIKYTNRENLYLQYKKDIEYISIELKQYLYDFGKVKADLSDCEFQIRKSRYSSDYKGLDIK